MEGVLGQTTLLRKMTSNLYDRSFLLIFFYLGLPFLKHAQCALIITPQNTVAMSGETVVLNCASDTEDSLTWAAYTPGSSRKEYIFSGHRLSQSVSSYISFAEERRGHCSLQINATRKAAKRYICIEQGSATTASAEFIVLERNPTCVPTVTEASVNITCSVEFFGNWAPIMEWKTRGNQNLKIEQHSSHTNLVSSSLFLPLNSTNIVAAFQVSVVTKFSESGRPRETSATNVPEYNHTTSPFGSGAGNSALRNAGYKRLHNACQIVVNLSVVALFFLNDLLLRE